MEEILAKWLNAALGLLGISSLAAISRSILSEDRRSLKGFLRGLTLALFAGGLAGAIIQDQDFSAPTQGAIVGIVAFVADDILLLIINMAAHMRKNPKDLVDFVLRRKI